MRRRPQDGAAQRALAVGADDDRARGVLVGELEQHVDRPEVGDDGPRPRRRPRARGRPRGPSASARAPRSAAACARYSSPTLRPGGWAAKPITSPSPSPCATSIATSSARWAPVRVVEADDEHVHSAPHRPRLRPCRRRPRAATASNPRRRKYSVGCPSRQSEHEHEAEQQERPADHERHAEAEHGAAAVRRARGPRGRTPSDEQEPEQQSRPTSGATPMKRKLRTDLVSSRR